MAINIGIFVILAVLAGLALTGNLPLASFGGGGVLSIDQTDYVSNDPSVNGPAWIVSVSVNQGGQSLTGSKSSSNIVDTQTGEVAKNDLRVDVSVDKEVCAYTLSSSSTPEHIYSPRVEEKYFPFDIGAQDFANQCAARPNVLKGPAYGSLWRYTNDNWRYVCFWREQAADVGIIQSPSLDFTATTTLTSGSTTTSATVSNTGNPTAELSGGWGFVKWNGNFGSGQECPKASDQRASVIRENQQWIIASRTKIDTYETYDQAGVVDCLKSIKTSGPNGENCRANYDAYSLDARSGGPYLYDPLSYVSAKITDNGATGKAEISLSQLYAYPVLTLQLKADYLGVYSPVGDPAIVTLSSNDFRSGTQGFISATIKNEGTVTATFVSSATCGSPISQNGNSPTIVLAPSQSGIVSIPIIGSASTKTSATCTVTVSDINNPTMKDSKTVTATVLPTIVCTPGYQRCDGNAVYQCNSQGSNFDILVDQCSSSEVCTIGPTGITATCAEPTTCPDGICTVGEQLLCPQDCSPAPPPIVTGTCGDNVCSYGESQSNCPADCHAPDVLGTFLADLVVGLIIAFIILIILFISPFRLLLLNLRNVALIFLIITLIVVFILGGFNL